ncbi:hypothetical protein [Geothrix fuzhouensis]|uniref:hypothetical protein n=1 Tax=Geothrix fuzhouensis TaxID=2966451 RepID=UPI0021473482|nr:hypothetical protein [Geothrix fuzhouensis]
MSYTVVNTAPPTRISLLDAAGVAQVRWTLQAPEREGRTLRWIPDGVMQTLGSARNWRRIWQHRGFRQELAVKWGYGLTSTREAWVSGAWSAPVERPTAEAHSEILAWSAKLPCRVEPFMGQPMPTFQAQSYEKGPSLADTKGVAHPRLELVLAGMALVNGVRFEKSSGGWGLGPWGLMPWGW